MTKTRALDEDQKQALRGLVGFTADGWTEDDVEALDARLRHAIGYGCVVVWDYYDLWGAGGNSDIWLVREDAAGRERRHELPDGLWQLLNDEGEPEECIRLIEADLGARSALPLKAADGFRWDRLHGEGANRYRAFDPRRELD